MKIHLCWLFAATTIGFFLQGCASPYTLNKEQRKEAYAQFIETEKLAQVDKITSFRFDGWSALGDEHLIISKSMNKPYLVTLNRPCFDLEHTMAIKIHNTGSTLMAKFDSITIPDSIEVKCFIKSIHELSKEQKKSLLKIGKKDEVDA